jgi:hypothetical protein
MWRGKIEEIMPFKNIKKEMYLISSYLQYNLPGVKGIVLSNHCNYASHSSRTSSLITVW